MEKLIANIKEEEMSRKKKFFIPFNIFEDLFNQKSSTS